MKGYRYTPDNADATPFDTFEEAAEFAKRIPAIDEPRVERLWDGYVIVVDRGGFAWVKEE